ALSQSRLHELEKELAELQDKFRSMKAKWENEKNAIGKVQTLRLAAPRREQMTKEHDTMAKNQNNNVAPATQKTDPGAKKDAL
ncbi:hypothetical protein, partial [Faecalibacterium duncaniae]|uniref:hypothetical protein n=1 Tax=Faecalibacterium duncaniae (strain DSM 17677 / JCM 31915 / A2-165) TaxID=411483 RepID=UPI002941261E